MAGCTSESMIHASMWDFLMGFSLYITHLCLSVPPSLRLCVEFNTWDVFSFSAEISQSQPTGSQCGHISEESLFCKTVKQCSYLHSMRVFGWLKAAVPFVHRIQWTPSATERLIDVFIIVFGEQWHRWITSLRLWPHKEALVCGTFLAGLFLPGTCESKLTITAPISGGSTRPYLHDCLGVFSQAGQVLSFPQAPNCHGQTL